MQIIQKTEADSFLLDMLRHACAQWRPGDRPTLVTYPEPVEGDTDDMPEWTLQGWDDVSWAKWDVRNRWKRTYPGEPCPIDTLPPPPEGHFYHIMTVFGRDLEVEVYPMPAGAYVPPGAKLQ